MHKQSETKFMIKSKKQVYRGFFFVCAFAILSTLFLFVRTFENMEPSWAFNVGIEMMSLYVGVIIYYSCMQDSEVIEEYTIMFSSLLMTATFGVFLDLCAWVVQGVAMFAFANRLVNALMYANNYMMILMFWRYVVFTLAMKEKMVRIVNRILNILCIPCLLLALLNLWFPIYFSVDSAGVYQREVLFPLSMLGLIVTLPALIIGFITSKVAWKEKIIAGSFIILPLFSEIISVLYFGVSLMFAASLLSVVLIFGVLVARRGRKLSATQTELHMATQIQTSMIPGIFPAFPFRKEFDLYASMDPAREVGGDFYDFFLIDDDHLGIVMADVSGKGVPAALYMMASKIIIANNAMMSKSPAKVLEDTNNSICSNNREDMFVTTWLGILEISTGKLTAANAGHEYPVIRQSGGKFEILKDRHSFIIGGIENTKYKEYEVLLKPGAKLFIYTDGVPEAMNASGEMFGLERMLENLNGNISGTPEDILTAMRHRINEFVGDAPQFDDMTMLCLEYRGCGEQK